VRLVTDAELTVTADPVRLLQAVGNLVSNAVRHTPPGGTVHLAAADESSGPAPGPAGMVRVEVRDTGPGITPEDLPHVCDRFWRAEKSRSRQTGGFGLPIVRKPIEAPGGPVEAPSTPGVGSVFVLRLPSDRALRDDRGTGGSAQAAVSRNRATSGPRASPLPGCCLCSRPV
jgi:two-component system sensor histidine kinase BaeS